jgi:hypothetical protein
MTEPCHNDIITYVDVVILTSNTYLEFVQGLVKEDCLIITNEAALSLLNPAKLFLLLALFGPWKSVSQLGRPTHAISNSRVSRIHK